MAVEKTKVGSGTPRTAQETLMNQKGNTGIILRAMMDNGPLPWSCRIPLIRCMRGLLRTPSRKLSLRTVFARTCKSALPSVAPYCGKYKIMFL
jgi:hypothetical protein